MVVFLEGLPKYVPLFAKAMHIEALNGCTTMYVLEAKGTPRQRSGGPWAGWGRVGRLSFLFLIQ